MKILFVVDDFAGGAGNVVGILANELQKRKFSVEILLLNAHTPSIHINETIPVHQEHISSATTNKIQWLFDIVHHIQKKIKLISPDVVISFLDNNNTLCGLALRKDKTPLIVCERSNPIAIKPKGLWRILRIFGYKKAKFISVQCSNFKKFSKLYQNKTIVTPNPVIKPKFVAMGICGENVRFVSCARLSPIKQFDKMLDAFALIHKEANNTVLDIYGDGALKEQLKEKIHILGLEDAVYLKGSTSEVQKVLSEHDIYLMTSQQEGFPNALCEAMSVGLPAIAFECHEGLRDIVQSENNGFLVSPDDINAMAQHALKLIHDAQLYQSIAKNAKNISNKFCTKHIVDLWIDIIEDTI